LTTFDIHSVYSSCCFRLCVDISHYSSHMKRACFSNIITLGNIYSLLACVTLLKNAEAESYASLAWSK
jgi:hypothetical protein